jgi:hypothetical protein
MFLLQNIVLWLKTNHSNNSTLKRQNAAKCSKNGTQTFKKVKKRRKQSSRDSIEQGYLMPI